MHVQKTSIIDHVRSTREGNVFTAVCYSVRVGGGGPCSMMQQDRQEVRSTPHSSQKDQVGRWNHPKEGIERKDWSGRSGPHVSLPDRKNWTGSERLVRKEGPPPPGGLDGMDWSGRRPPLKPMLGRGRLIMTPHPRLPDRRNREVGLWSACLGMLIKFPIKILKSKTCQ